jgi:catechol 2,3-dioxygenase-like lactoylglutathione lyase family enzyme
MRRGEQRNAVGIGKRNNICSAASIVKVRGIDHVQIAMPSGGEELGRKFYGELLGLAEIPKPAKLASRGGLWFHCGSLQLHLGVEASFRAAKKAHPALLVEDLASLLGILKGAGYEVKDDEPLTGFDRAFTCDPFGNRIELLEPHAK